MVGAAVWAAASLTACGSDEPPRVLLPMALHPAPVDATRPGEMAEGSVRAFGLPLPRDVNLVAQLPKAWTAESAMGLSAVANFVRDRVATERVETGPTRTVFMDAVPRDDEGKTLRVTVARKAGKTLIIVRDETRVPAEKGLTERERWEQAGIGPDGKPFGDENL